MQVKQDNRGGKALHFDNINFARESKRILVIYFDLISMLVHFVKFASSWKGWIQKFQIEFALYEAVGRQKD